MNPSAVKRLHIRRYVCHVDQTFEFSPNVNVVTGANGAGKSTMLEALVWAIYGTAPCRNPGTEELDVEFELFDGHTYRRTRKGHAQVCWVDGKRYPNKNGMEHALAPLFGHGPAWIKSLYLTGATVGAYAALSPSAQFGHVQQLFQLEKYKAYAATAHSKCADLRATVESLGHSVHTDSGNASRFVAQAERTQYKTGSTTAVISLCARRDRLLDESVQLNAQLADSERQLQDIEPELRALRKLPKAEARTCSECNQQYHVRNSDAHTIEECTRVLEESYFNYDRLRQMLYAKLQHNTDELSHTERQIRAVEQADETLCELEDTFRQCVVTAFNWRRSMLQAEAELRSAKTRLALAEKLYDALRVTNKNGLPYFRMRQLLEQVVSYANHYLAKMQTSLRFHVCILDAALQFYIVDGPVRREYASCSAGQRRRVDIAVSLAFAATGAALGSLPSTAPLVLDEAFDTLDSTGVQALVELACDISAQRQTFLISHVEPAVGVSPQIRHIHIEGSGT